MGAGNRTRSVAVHHVEDGPYDAPPLLLAHSLGTDHRLWQPHVERLQRSWRVVRYDHRGHGLSPVPRGPYRIADLGRDTLRLLDRLELDRVSFAGTCLGGAVGLWVAAHAPERIDRLVVCCTTAWAGDPEVWLDRARIVRANGTVTIADAAVHRCVQPAFARRNPDAMTRLVARFVGTTDQGYAASCEAVASMDLRTDLRRVTAPTLVVAARHDRTIPRDDVEDLARRLPDAQLVTVEDAGHLAAVERPDTITDLLERHLRSPMLASA